MRIEIRIDRQAPRRWHERLRDRLARLLPDSSVRLRLSDGDAAYPAAVDVLLFLERTVLRRMRPSLCDRVAGFDGAEIEADLVIDLTGAGLSAGGERKPGCGPRTLRPLYDGSLCEMTAISALLSGDFPFLALKDSTDGAIVATGLPSLEASDSLTGGLDAVFSRVITLIEQAILSPRRTFDRVAQMSATLGQTPAKRGAAAMFLRNTAHVCLRQIYHLCCHSPHWRVGWRFNDGPGVMETGDLGGPAWNVLRVPGSGFSADPFPVEWKGQTALFFEHLDYESGKGKIFVQRLDASGPFGDPFLALEEPWHLSYPFLIAHKGELYMLPEASNSGAVSIYRCIEFPGKWQCVGQLLTGIEAADATIFEHAGRFWMTSVVRDGIGGYSDTLAIHHAPDLFGPWEEHARRPALVDSRLARPAGAVVARDGVLWRPVQDCSTGYGKKLALARIDSLDPENFAQTPMRLISPGPHWPGRRLHTLNRWGRLECIDGVVLTPKNKLLRGLVHDAIDRRPTRAPVGRHAIAHGIATPASR